MKNYQDFLTINYNKELIPGLFEMELEGEGASFITAPGQFINIKINDSLQPYLRRPMSILDYDDTHIKLIYRIRGEGTKILSEKEPGEKLDVLIGLGNGFTDTDYNEVIVVGGGSGTPPMYGLAKRLIEKGVKVTAVLGFNGSYDVFYEEEFKKLCPTYISTMDGTCGTKGTVIDAIKENNLTFDHYYACGPEPMLDALVKNFPDNGSLSFEARMGCGFGACMGCSCKVKTKPYKRICVEGPVLSSDEVIING